MKYVMNQSPWDETGTLQRLEISDNSRTIVDAQLSWGDVLRLRNFLDAKLGARERDRRASQQRHSSLRDDDNVSLHVVED
jgi:hypothetical protein